MQRPAAYPRHMSRSVLLIVPLALALSACGSSAGSTGSAAASNTGSTINPGSAGKTPLHVRHVFDPRWPPVYVEGTVWHVRVVDSRGSPVADRQLLKESTSVRLPPGRYRLESEELPCDGNCHYLDSPMDFCSADFVAEPGTELAATVTVRPAHGCAIDFAEERAT
jgi:hypothetical protein